MHTLTKPEAHAHTRLHRWSVPYALSAPTVSQVKSHHMSQSGFPTSPNRSTQVKNNNAEWMHLCIQNMLVAQWKCIRPAKHVQSYQDQQCTKSRSNWKSPSKARKCNVKSIQQHQGICNSPKSMLKIWWNSPQESKPNVLRSMLKCHLFQCFKVLSPRMSGCWAVKTAAYCWCCSRQ